MIHNPVQETQSSHCLKIFTEGIQEMFKMPFTTTKEGLQFQDRTKLNYLEVKTT